MYCALALLDASFFFRDLARRSLLHPISRWLPFAFRLLLALGGSNRQSVDAVFVWARHVLHAKSAVPVGLVESRDSLVSCRNHAVAEDRRWVLCMRLCACTAIDAAAPDVGPAPWCGATRLDRAHLPCAELNLLVRRL